MNRSRQARWWFALCAAGQLAMFPLFAAAGSTNSPVPARSSAVPAILMPPVPPSPVAYFRQLLAMPPKERANSLTNRAPEARQRILDKINEYLALAPNERELRLRATELRWYLMPLFQTAPADRAAVLGQVPDELRDLVKSRLARWDTLTPEMQKEFLDNDHTRNYLTHVETTNSAAANPNRQKIADAFNRFFEFTPEETQQALNTLSAAERAQMEKTLETFSKLPPAQRAQCIRAFTEFASMSAADRAEFLKNAENWSKMPPKERQAWRDLVAQIPLWPPMPPALLMPPPPLPRPAMRPAQRTPPVVATNHL
jgi:hypothetical protein